MALSSVLVIVTALSPLGGPLVPDVCGPLMFQTLCGTLSVKPCTDNNSCSSDVRIVAGFLLKEFSIFGTRLGFGAIIGDGVPLSSWDTFSIMFLISVDFRVMVWTVAVLGVMAMDETDSLMFQGPRDGADNS